MTVLSQLAYHPPKAPPCTYPPFTGEQHGFRRAEDIKRSLEAEPYFYGRILGFEPA